MADGHFPAAAWRWGLIGPVAVAAAALALAVVGAVITESRGGAGALNVFVETLSGRSGSGLGGVSSALPFGFAFAAGLVSAVNPCGFAMLPAYLGLYLGQQEGERRQSFFGRLGRALAVGGAVTAGFVVLFGVAGVIITGGASPVVDAIPWIGLTIGVLLVIAGAWLLKGKVYLGFAARAASRMGDPKQLGPRGYFFFGLSYGTASLSCTLPIFLAVIGTSLAVGQLGTQIGQFVLFALGMGLVIMLLTIAMALFKGAMAGALRKALPYVQPLSTGFMILAGMYVVYYWLTIGGLLDKIA